MHCSIKTLQGTSMATPAAAGMAALAREYFTSGFYPSGSANTADKFNPSGALIKAVLIHGAQKLSKVVSASSGLHTTLSTLSSTLPDSNQGYGRLELDYSLYFGTCSPLCSVTGACPLQTTFSAGTTISTAIPSNPLELSYFVWGSSGANAQPVDNTYVNSNGGVTTVGLGQFFYFTAPSTPSDIVVTLVWTDYPGTSSLASTTSQLVNQLDVLVEGPCTNSNTCGSIWHSSLYDTTNPTVPINPHAKVTVPAGDLTAGAVYRIYVGPWMNSARSNRGTVSHTQPFALVASASLPFQSNLKPYSATDTPYAKYTLPGESKTYVSSAASTLIGVFSVAAAILGGLVGIIYFSHKQAARLEDEEIAQRIGGMMAAGAP